jgi:hypothetical protein
MSQVNGTHRTAETTKPYRSGSLWPLRERSWPRQGVPQGNNNADNNNHHQQQQPQPQQQQQDSTPKLVELKHTQKLLKSLRSMSKIKH